MYFPLREVQYLDNAGWEGITTRHQFSEKEVGVQTALFCSKPLSKGGLFSVNSEIKVLEFFDKVAKEIVGCKTVSAIVVAMIELKSSDALVLSRRDVFAHLICKPRLVTRRQTRKEESCI
jgi:hypothetical protein